MAQQSFQPDGNYMLPYLRQWREYRLMTRGELAAAAGMSESTVVKLENQTQAARISTIAKLAAALKVTREQLVWEAPPERGN